MTYEGQGDQEQPGGREVGKAWPTGGVGRGRHDFQMWWGGRYDPEGLGEAEQPTDGVGGAGVTHKWDGIESPTSKLTPPPTGTYLFGSSSSEC